MRSPGIEARYLTVNLHYFQHVPFEALGSIEHWAFNRRHAVTATRFSEGDPLPSLNQIDWLLVMGGPMNVYEEQHYPWLAQEKRFIEETIQAGKVVLGICLGAQLIADVLGAKVYRNPYQEIGWYPIEKTKAAAASSLFRVLPSTLEVFHWHGDTFDIPSGAIHLARSAACENQAFLYDERVLGLQFHLEMTRQAAEQLIVNCAGEIAAGAFTQSAETMLSEEQRFKTSNETLDDLLDHLQKI
jgi:GMP synthase-like glutamine amidotransferase